MPADGVLIKTTEEQPPAIAHGHLSAAQELGLGTLEDEMLPYRVFSCPISAPACAGCPFSHQGRGMGQEGPHYPGLAN